MATFLLSIPKRINNRNKNSPLE